MDVRRAIAIFLPSAVLATALCGLVYSVIQQDLRTGANDPQEQLALDAAARLDNGTTPHDVVGSQTIDLASSLAPFLVVHDTHGSVLATDAELDGHPPVLPVGVLEAATASGRNAVTWQPRSDVRMATITVPWTGGTVTAGRSLRLVEQRESAMQLIVAAAWVATLAALAVAASIASWLWPHA